MTTQIAPDTTATGLAFYVCPACRQSLLVTDKALVCQACRAAYPLAEGIPDFLGDDRLLQTIANPLLRRLVKTPWLAQMYESRWWYPLVLNVYAGRHTTTREELVRLVDAAVGEAPLILDAACGPGTLGRRIVQPGQTVYGIDLAPGLLQGGRRMAQADGLTQVYFARAQVEELPFADGVFDAAVCGGALHLFHRPAAALGEIGRTLKPGAPLAVTTFTVGEKGLFHYARVRQALQARRGLHPFTWPELEGYLSEAGFTDFAPQAFGSFTFFQARKR